MPIANSGRSNTAHPTTQAPGWKLSSTSCLASCLAGAGILQVMIGSHSAASVRVVSALRLQPPHVWRRLAGARPTSVGVPALLPLPREAWGVHPIPICCTIESYAPQDHVFLSKGYINNNVADRVPRASQSADHHTACLKDDIAICIVFASVVEGFSRHSTGWSWKAAAPDPTPLNPPGAALGGPDGINPAAAAAHAHKMPLRYYGDPKGQQQAKYTP